MAFRFVPHLLWHLHAAGLVPGSYRQTFHVVAVDVDDDYVEYWHRRAGCGLLESGAPDRRRLRVSDVLDRWYDPVRSRYDAVPEPCECTRDLDATYGAQLTTETRAAIAWVAFAEQLLEEAEASAAGEVAGLLGRLRAMLMRTPDVAAVDERAVSYLAPVLDRARSAADTLAGDPRFVADRTRLLTERTRSALDGRYGTRARFLDLQLQVYAHLSRVGAEATAAAVEGTGVWVWGHNPLSQSFGSYDGSLLDVADVASTVLGGPVRVPFGIAGRFPWEWEAAVVDDGYALAEVEAALALDGDTPVAARLAALRAAAL